VVSSKSLRLSEQSKYSDNRNGRVRMRNWNERLYLRAMPGRPEIGSTCNTVAEWLAEMDGQGIRTVVCLAPDKQIESVSPEYAEWRQKQKALSPSPYELIDLPIEDFGIPEVFQRKRFWEVARDIARRIDKEEKLFVHCSAGRGRTGMFAVAVLCQMGCSLEEAYEEINKIESAPETPQQHRFLSDNCFYFDFGMMKLDIGDELQGPKGAEAIVGSGGGGTLLRMIEPEYEGLVSLRFATVRLLGIDPLTPVDILNYWTYHKQTLFERYQEKGQQLRDLGLRG
jgi:protein-tyrosine phosphatase